MRTKFSKVLLGSLIIAAIFCGAMAQASTRLTLSGGGMGGGWFIYLTALADVWEPNIPDLMTTVVPGAGISNIISVDEKLTDIGLTFNINAFEAIHGLEPFGKKYTDLRSLFNMRRPAIYHFPVLSRLGISSLDELVEKQYPIRIDSGQRGSGGELGVSRILEAHGVTYEDIRSWGGSVSFSSQSDAIGRIRDGHLDAVWNNATLGIPWLLDLTQTTEVTFLTLNEEAVEKLQKTYGYVPELVEAGVYPKQDQPFLSVSELAIAFVHKDMDEDLVYTLTKLVWENIDYLYKIHPGFEDMDPKTSWMDAGFELHPGAERYYREMGYMP